MLGTGTDGTGTDGTGTDDSVGEGETTGGELSVGDGETTGGGSSVGDGETTGGGSSVGDGETTGGGGGGGCCVVPAGGAGGGVVWAGVDGEGECDFAGVGVGRGAGDRAGPMNGILTSDSFGLALFVGLACGVVLVDLLGECVDDRVGVPWGDRVDPVIVSEGIGAGDGLSNLNCGSAPPL